jgi:hypothetical protein
MGWTRCLGFELVLVIGIDYGSGLTNTGRTRGYQAGEETYQRIAPVIIEIFYSNNLPLSKCYVLIVIIVIHDEYKNAS